MKPASSVGPPSAAVTSAGVPSAIRRPWCSTNTRSASLGLWRPGESPTARKRFAPAWRTQLGLTLLDATYRDGFLACAGIPCAAPTLPIAAGDRIVGTQRGNAFAELVWQPAAATELALELRSGSGTAANDANTQFAPRYALANLRVSQRYAIGDGVTVEMLARVDNLADRVYAGSVIVNAANGRYFEPGATRSLLLSARFVRSF